MSRYFIYLKSQSIEEIFFLLLSINIVLSNSIFNSSLNEKYKLAEAYYESNLYDDAIIIYEEILDIQESIAGIPNSNLLGTIQKIYKLFACCHQDKLMNDL